MDTQKLIELHPFLYHMAESNSWETIKTMGLLSSNAIIDIANIPQDFSKTAHRPEKVKLSINGFSQQVVLRDQKPMPPQRIRQALTDGTSPEQWYDFINSKVFFWTQKERLMRLLNARAYRHFEHDVLVIDSSRLILDYEHNILLCHMNSGNTWPFPHQRDLNIFLPIHQYLTNNKGNPIKPIVELVVDYKIPNIVDYVVSVHKMQGSNELYKIL